MNLKVVKFLLANQAALLKIVEIAKGWRKDLPFADQWAMVDSIARLVIPILEAQTLKPKALYARDFEALDYDGDTYDTKLLAVGAEVSALGIDWKLLLEVIVPIVLSILKALAAGKEE
jgi:hypothetical protein